MKKSHPAAVMSKAAFSALVLAVSLGASLVPGAANAGAPGPGGDEATSAYRARKPAVRSYSTRRPAGRSPSARKTGKFSDVPRNHWAYEAIKELYSRGIIKGYPDTSAFRGEQPLTRYEMAVALKHLIENLRSPLSDLDPETVSTISKLTREYEEELVEMKVKLDIFREQLSEFFTLLRNHDGRLDDHEARIQALESGNGRRSARSRPGQAKRSRTPAQLPDGRPWSGPFEGGRFALGAKFGFLKPDGGDLGSMFGSRETLTSGEMRFFMTPRLALSTTYGTWKTSDSREIPEIMPGLRANTSVKLTPWFVRGLFFTRPGRAFNPYFGVGLSRVKSELFYADAMRTINSIATDNGVTLCAGLEYFLTRSFSLTTEMNLMMVDRKLGIQSLAKDYDVELDDGFFTTGLNVYFK